MADVQPVPDDPLYKQSLSLHTAIAVGFMVLSFVWATYDEFWHRKPFKGYMSDFAGLYDAHLRRVEPIQEAKVKRIKSPDVAADQESPVHKTWAEIAGQLEALKQAQGERPVQVDREVRRVKAEINALNEVFPVVRSRIEAEVYLLEKAREHDDQAEAARLQAGIEEIKNEKHKVPFPSSARQMNFHEMKEEFTRLSEQRNGLQKEQVALNVPRAELESRLGTHVKNHLDGPTPEAVRGLRAKNEAATDGIRQIHIVGMEPKGGDVVDRCESCHLGTREPVEIRKEDMGGRVEFTSHPNPELLARHDPERFGCVSCHNGNGVALTTVTLAHGKNKHWLHPLYARENLHAGCQHCHRSDLVLKGGDTLNLGKELFRHRGCWGCHPYQGFDQETDSLQQIALERRALSDQRVALERARTRANQISEDEKSTPEQVIKANFELTNTLTLQGSTLDTRARELDDMERSFNLERKKVGPNLKDLKAKVRKEWIPVWLKAPHDYRPDTKMPAFRLNPSQLQSVSAYIWQNAIDPVAAGVPLPKRKTGDAARGKTVFEIRGCLGCHTVGEGEQKIGDGFATNLTRVGEKVKYDFLVRWIQNPRLRLLPYSPTLDGGRDVTPADYQKKGVPFVFDRNECTDPIEGKQMLVEQQTVMPNLRLSDQDAEDIASWLMTQRKVQDSEYPSADWIDDPKLAAEGAHWVRHFGCSGCHEIAGMEKEGRIGTELTEWGSKPIERLDFALYTHEAEKTGWYDHKGFAMKKLEAPDYFDHLKHKENEQDKLRMPDFHLPKEQINALTTFLLGSTELKVNPAWHYRPAEKGLAIRDGWWIVKKYNCVGCHSFEPGVEPALWHLPQFSGDNQKLRPPSLVGQGARTQPDWLGSFLINPAQSDKDLHRNGVRVYLETRMPTFGLSKNEISKLIRFFAAMADQSGSYVPTPLMRLEGKELQMARDAFAAAKCASCHAVGDPKSWTPEQLKAFIAPSFTLAARRLSPKWNREWLVDPARFQPGTKMPAGLFKQVGSKWVLEANPPASMAGYQGDHVELLIRYLNQYDEAEAARN